MIVDFSVQNYRSIRDMESLSMYAASKISRNKELEETNLIRFSSKISLLKTKTLYGANASGKSNIIKALASFRRIVLGSVKDEKILEANIQSFSLSREALFKPTFFQLSFIYNNIYYRYGFEATSEEIVAEWLFGTPGKKEVPFFHRQGKDIYVNENQFQEGTKVIDLYKQSNNDIARNNALFLTTVRSFNQGLARDIIDYLDGYILISGISDLEMHLIAEQSIGDEFMRKKIVKLLQLADVGIDDIYREEEEVKTAGGQASKRYFVLARHKGVAEGKSIEAPVDLLMSTQESEGTKKMFEISPALIYSLDHNRVLVVDEFDARFHPMMSKKIMELYHSISNKSAQLIVATHDTNLLTSQQLRRDQICFVEKDGQGASHYYSLADFKGVRNDASFEKDYIAGKYGAIPFLGDFASILES